MNVYSIIIFISVRFIVILNKPIHAIIPNDKNINDTTTTANSTPKKTYLFISGFPQSGTSLIHTILQYTPYVTTMIERCEEIYGKKKCLNWNHEGQWIIKHTSSSSSSSVNEFTQTFQPGSSCECQVNKMNDSLSIYIKNTFFQFWQQSNNHHKQQNSYQHQKQQLLKQPMFIYVEKSPQSMTKINCIRHIFKNETDAGHSVKFLILLKHPVTLNNAKPKEFDWMTHKEIKTITTTPHRSYYRQQQYNTKNSAASQSYQKKATVSIVPNSVEQIKTNLDYFIQFITHNTTSFSISLLSSAITGGRCSVGWLPTIQLLYQQLQSYELKAIQHNIRILRFEDFQHPYQVCQALYRFLLGHRRNKQIIEKNSNSSHDDDDDDDGDGDDSNNKYYYDEVMKQVCDQYFKSSRDNIHHHHHSSNASSNNHHHNRVKGSSHKPNPHQRGQTVQRYAASTDYNNTRSIDHHHRDLHPQQRRTSSSSSRKISSSSSSNSTSNGSSNSTRSSSSSSSSSSTRQLRLRSNFDLKNDHTINNSDSNMKAFVFKSDLVSGGHKRFQDFQKAITVLNQSKYSHHHHHHDHLSGGNFTDNSVNSTNSNNGKMDINFYDTLIHRNSMTTMTKPSSSSSSSSSSSNNSSNRNRYEKIHPSSLSSSSLSSFQTTIDYTRILHQLDEYIRLYGYNLINNRNNDAHDDEMLYSKRRRTVLDPWDLMKQL